MIQKTTRELLSKAYNEVTTTIKRSSDITDISLEPFESLATDQEIIQELNKAYKKIVKKFTSEQKELENSYKNLEDDKIQDENSFLEYQEDFKNKVHKLSNYLQSIEEAIFDIGGSGESVILEKSEEFEIEHFDENEEIKDLKLVIQAEKDSLRQVEGGITTYKDIKHDILLRIEKLEKRKNLNFKKIQEAKDIINDYGSQKDSFGNAQNTLQTEEVVLAQKKISLAKKNIKNFDFHQHLEDKRNELDTLNISIDTQLEAIREDNKRIEAMTGPIQELKEGVKIREKQKLELKETYSELRQCFGYVTDTSVQAENKENIDTNIQAQKYSSKKEASSKIKSCLKIEKIKILKQKISDLEYQARELSFQLVKESRKQESLFPNRQQFLLTNQ